MTKSKDENLVMEKVAESNPPLYHAIDTGFVLRSEGKKDASNQEQISESI